MTRFMKSFALAVALLFSLAAVSATAQSVKTHHVREAVRSGKAAFVSRMPANQTLQLDLVLPLRDPEGLKGFLADLYNPNSSSFRQFLTPQQFTARFGPTSDQYEAVLRFAKNYGLEVVGGSRDGMDVQVKASVAAIETAFHVSMRNYQHPTENRTFFSPDVEPTLDLPFNLWHISGLDNYSIPHSLRTTRDAYAAAHGIEPDAVVSHATTGSGQNLGLLEYYGTNRTDLHNYYTGAGQTYTTVPITLLSVDGTSTSCSYPRCDDGEQNLDMTQALGMAPALASLTMYIGSTDTAIISAMTTHSPLPTTIGCSWGWTPPDPSTLDPYFQKMAAQGQTFFAASGDSSTWSTSNYAWPADDAYVVSVGGTDLVTSSAAGPWSSETAWVDSGGGISPDSIAIPSWQQLSGVINSSNKGSTTYRNGPDVSANANFTFYTCADLKACQANVYGGTSFAAPMWAAYLALVNQQLATNGQSPIGFINSTIYSQNVTSAYASDFHDITSGTSGSYSAVTGYDLVTGWGSPNTGLLNALVNSVSTTPSFTLSASPSALSIAQSSGGSTTISSSVSGGFSSSIALTVSGLPTGVTAAFSPTSITGAGSSTLSFTVGSTAAAGTYSITVTGTSGSIVSSTTVTLTVTGVSAGFSISAAPTSLSVSRSHSGTVTVTTAVTGGFSSAIALSASGQGSGTTISFSPSSITGAGSATMTITASRTATTGTRTITITGKSGSTSHATTVSLTVTK